MPSPGICRSEQVEEENARPRRLVAEPVAGPGDVAGGYPPKTVRSARKRELVDEARGDWDVSIRRVCRVLERDISTCHYNPAAASRPALRPAFARSARPVFDMVIGERVAFFAAKAERSTRGEAQDLQRVASQLHNKVPKRRAEAKLTKVRCVPPASMTCGQWLTMVGRSRVRVTERRARQEASGKAGHDLAAPSRFRRLSSDHAPPPRKISGSWIAAQLRCVGQASG